MTLTEAKKGTTFKKGNRKRTFNRIEGKFVYYSVPSDNVERYELVETFERWAQNAELLGGK